jgi:hypothetical protein
MKLIKLLVVVGFILVIFNPVFVLAQQTTTTTSTTTAPASQTALPKYSGVDSSLKNYLCTPSEQADGKDLERCINRLYRFSLSAGALVLVFFLVLAGYLYITSGEAGKTKAKSILMNSISGMAILAGSYLLLYFINPSLVAFKPIQPPVFTTQGLPSCEAVGFGVNCIVNGDEETAINQAAGRGIAIACPNGLVSYDKSVPANDTPASSQICKAMMDKLKAVHAKHKIIVTSTVRSGGSESLCHKINNEKTGTCADIGSSSGDWDGLCKAIQEVGGLKLLNESGKDSPNCGKFVKTKYWTGAHLHVNLVGN